jgi:hypothetical protein
LPILYCSVKKRLRFNSDDDDEESIDSGLMEYQHTKTGITQNRRFSVSSQNSLCTMNNGHCRYKTYKHDPGRHKSHYNSGKNSRKGSAQGKRSSSSDEDAIEEEQLEDVNYDEFHLEQSKFLQENLDRVEAMLKDMANNLDGEASSTLVP